MQTYALSNATTQVSGSVDRPPEMWIIISQVTSLLQICGMAFIVFGDSLLETFGLNPANTPKWLNSAKENKMGVVSEEQGGCVCRWGEGVGEATSRRTIPFRPKRGASRAH